MKAVQLIRHGKPGEFRVIDLPAHVLKSDEVVISVRACGLNRLDLWLEQGELPIVLQLPRTPGCEIAGQIIEVGSAVTDWRVGDRVAVQSNVFCGNCEFCKAGEESRCIHGILIGVQRDGGFSEEVAVPSRTLVKLPDEVSYETSAALTLSGSTAMHMFRRRTNIKEGDWVLVIGGASGVGSSAIQVATRLGANVIATGSTAEKREFALKLGARHVVDSSGHSWSADVRKLTDKRGVDLVVEHVGADVLEQAFQCLARGGTIVTCGATAGREVKFNLWPFFVKEQKLVGSYGRTRQDLRETLQWAAEGNLIPQIDRFYSLEETQNAFQALRERKVLGKLVVLPGAS